MINQWIEDFADVKVKIVIKRGHSCSGHGVTEMGRRMPIYRKYIAKDAIMRCICESPLPQDLLVALDGRIYDIFVRMQFSGS